MDKLSLEAQRVILQDRLDMAERYIKLWQERKQRVLRKLNAVRVQYESNTAKRKTKSSNSDRRMSKTDKWDEEDLINHDDMPLLTSIHVIRAFISFSHYECI